MKKRIILSLAIVLCFVMAFAGCTMPQLDSYTISMLDLEDGVIRSGDLDEIDILDDKGKKTGEKNDIIYKFTEEELKDDMFAHKTIVADKDDYGKDYMAHPDSILLKSKNNAGKYVFGKEILTMFPLGHGKGELKAKFSKDGGMEYASSDLYTKKDGKAVLGAPGSWKYSQETPTLYRLVFSKDNVPDDNDLLILTSGNPLWPGDSSYKANGFNVSISERDDVMGEGRVWSEFETWYGRGDDIVKGGINRSPKGIFGTAADPIVAMSSLTRLKKQTKNAEGVVTATEWDNRWMGLYHDHQFNLYKTILSFAEPTAEETKANLPTYNVPNADGKVVPMVMHWSEPVKYYDDYRKIEMKSQTCEVECIRSDAGNGDRLALLMRANSKKTYSVITFSDDEGETWSAPREVPQALSGERHKAEWIKAPDGTDMLFITFRSIERSTKKVNRFAGGASWMSEGYVAWVGTWDDLEKGKEGSFRVKLAHTYLDNQEKTSRSANGDTGYCGNVVYNDGKTLATCSYGKFMPDYNGFKGKQTYIVGRVIDVDTMFNLMTAHDTHNKTAE